jgi:ATP-binding cassette subfamily B protein
MEKTMRTVIKYARPYLFTALFALTIKAVSVFSELAIPKMLAIIIDENVPRGDMAAVLQNGAIMLLFAVLTFLFNVIGNRTSAHVTGRIARDLRSDLFKKTLYLEASDTDRIGLSSLTSRLTADSYNITNFFARIIRLGMKAPLMLIGGIIITLTIDYRLALILIAVLPPVGFTVCFITRRSVPIYNSQQRKQDEIVSRVDETASGIRVIKALSKENYEKNKFSASAKALSDKEIEAGRLTSLTKPINDFIFYMGLCLVIVVGAFMAKADGEAASGKLLAFMTYFTVILNNMIMMTRIFVQASRAVASASRIEEVLLITEEQKPATLEGGDCPESDSYIVFDGVTFSYGGAAPTLKNISFTLKKGETLGIIGATGSGKTTLISLLLGLYEPTSGNIYIGGREIRDIPRKELYSTFGVALQNDFIFSGTLKDNIAFFRESEASDIEAAIETAQAREFILDTEEGLDRTATTAGTNLSGGQKQRLLISRALLGSPEIVILDDSSSALDYKTDKALRTALRERVGTTTVIVSQRIASVMGADKILVVDGGRITDVGSHGELLEKSEIYRDIASVQQI